MVKVSSMTSPRSGRPVANQFIITLDGAEYFQSYKTVIAKYDYVNRAGITLDTNWDYSNTTRKYLYRFLGMNRLQVTLGIESGDIKVLNLN